jgi:putative Holliday junction resolvase
MIVADINALTAALRRHERLFGLDLGEKTIGIAISDPGLHVASPLTTIRRTKFTLDAKELIKLIQERQVGGLVIGLPLNMDGSEGPRCQSVRQFAANFLQLHQLPIAFWDERLSTVAVTRDMLEADMSRAKRAKNVDKAAAAFILQGALDFHQRQKGHAASTE